MKRIPFWTALIALLLAIALLSPALADNSTPKRGDIITMGTYEQDGNTKNGAEPIEWMVLDEKDDRLLVISVKALDAMSYQETKSIAVSQLSSIWWENCSLRKWLNKDFLTKAFSADEQKKILSAKISTSVSTQSIRGTFETEDRLFCLSSAELSQYFPTNQSMLLCKGTKVAKANYWGESSDDRVRWWLRDVPKSDDLMIGDNFSCAACVDSSPSRGAYIIDLVCWSNAAVRPAMWIRRDSPAASSDSIAETALPADVSDKAKEPAPQKPSDGITIGTQTIRLGSINYTEDYDAGSGYHLSSSKGVYLCCTAKVTNIGMTTIKSADIHSPSVFWSGLPSGEVESSIAYSMDAKGSDFVFWPSIGNIKAGETLDIVFLTDLPKEAQTDGELYLHFDDGSNHIIRQP